MVHLLFITMAYFHVISISLIFGGDYPCAHYSLWKLPLCILLLCSMAHYAQCVTIAKSAPCGIRVGNDVARDINCDVTIGNGVARDINCDVTIGNDVAMCTYHGITMDIMTLL